MKQVLFVTLLVGSCTAQKPVQVALNPTSSPKPANSPTPKPKATPEPPPVEVRAVEFSRDLKWMAVGTLRRTVDIDGTISVWNCSTNKVEKSWTLKGGAKFVAFSPDGTLLAVAGTERRLTVWNWQKGNVLHSQTMKFELGGDDRMALAYSPDGRSLAVGVEDVQLLNTRNWKGRNLSAGIVGDIHFSPDGRVLLTSDDFEGTSGFSLIPLNGGKVRRISNFLCGKTSFSRDGCLFAGRAEEFFQPKNGEGIGPYDATFVWDTRTLKKQTFKTELFDPQFFSPDSRLIAGVNLSNAYDSGYGPPLATGVEIWSVKTGKRVRRWKQSARRVVYLHAKTLLAGDEKGVVRLKVR